jgi:hypothetical protein
MRMTVVNTATDQDAPPLLARVGGWAVTRGGLYCLYCDYHIEKERLQHDWVRHMRFPKKSWVKVADFEAALRLARSMAELGYL